MTDHVHDGYAREYVTADGGAAEAAVAAGAGHRGGGKTTTTGGSPRRPGSAAVLGGAGVVGTGGGRADALLALMTTAELQWKVRALSRERLDAPAGEHRHVVGQELLRLLRELNRRARRPDPLRGRPA